MDATKAVESAGTLEGTRHYPRLRPVYVRVLTIDGGDDVDPQIRVLAVPDPFFANPGDTVEWRSEHRFAVHFGENTPLTGAVVVQSDGEGAEPYMAAQRVREDAASTRLYKYTLAVTDGNGQVHLADPYGVVEKDPKRG